MLIHRPNFSAAKRARIQKALGLMLKAYIDIVSKISEEIPDKQEKKVWVDRCESFRLKSFGSFALLVCKLVGIPPELFSL